MIDLRAPRHSSFLPPSLVPLSTFGRVAAASWVCDRCLSHRRHLFSTPRFFLRSPFCPSRRARLVFSTGGRPSFSCNDAAHVALCSLAPPGGACWCLAIHHVLPICAFPWTARTRRRRWQMLMNRFPPVVPAGCLPLFLCFYVLSQARNTHKRNTHPHTHTHTHTHMHARCFFRGELSLVESANNVEPAPPPAGDVDSTLLPCPPPPIPAREVEIEQSTVCSSPLLSVSLALCLSPSSHTSSVFRRRMG